MSINDFLEEAERRTGGKGLSPAGQDVHEFAMMVYKAIKGGETKKWVKEAARMLVQSIAPTIPPSDAHVAETVIESIVLTALAELFSEGTLIKKEVYKDETRE